MRSRGDLDRIDDELRRGYDGDCWHGLPLRSVLNGVSARDAARKHPPLAHSIWALVNHLTAWIEVVVLRITERREITEPAAGDFAPVTDESEPAWAATLATLDKQQQALLIVITTLEPARLDEMGI